MPVLDIVLISVIVLLCIPMYLLFVFFGYIYCKQNNSWGVVLLFISLNIIGLILGVCLLYNSKNKLPILKPIPNELNTIE